MQCKKMQKMQINAKNASSYNLQNKRNGGPRKNFYDPKSIEMGAYWYSVSKKCVPDPDLIKIERKNQFLEVKFNFCIFQTF